MLTPDQNPDPIVEFELKDGSAYAIDFTTLCCVGKKAWKNITTEVGSETKLVTTLVTIGGNEVHIQGLAYEKVLEQWRRIRGLSSESYSSMQGQVESAKSGSPTS